MTALYPDAMTAACGQARKQHSATPAEQAAATRGVLRRVELGRLTAAEAHRVLDVLGLLPDPPPQPLEAADPPDTPTPPPEPPEPPAVPLGPGTAPHPGAVALAAAVRARRDELDVSLGELYRRGGPRPVVTGNIEKARWRSVRHLTRHRLDTGLGWAPGTTTRILGGTP